jgi:tetratricopeptide (TPR) repeat protein
MTRDDFVRLRLVSLSLLAALGAPSAWAQDPPDPTRFPSDYQPASAEQLVHEAWSRIDVGDYEGARIVAEQALGRTDDPARAHAALGAALELGGDPAAAIPHYEAALAGAGDGELAIHMQFRIAEAHGTLGHTEEALNRLDALGPVAGLSGEDVLKMRLVRAIWMIDTNRRRGLRDVARALDAAGPGEVTFYQAKARAAIVRALALEADALPLDGSERRQVRNLNRRAELIALAEKQVVAAIELEEPEWALESLIALGGAYEDVGDDLLAVPAPPRLTPDQAILYRQLVAGKVEVIYTKASKCYDGGLELAQRTQWRSRRIEQLADALDAVRPKIEDAHARAEPPP